MLRKELLLIVVILLLLFILLCVTVKATEFNETDVLNFEKTTYTFNQTMNFSSIKANNNTLWLNDIPFCTNGSGKINIKFYSFTNINDFNFTFNSTKNKDTINFTIGDQQFYREYSGEDEVVSMKAQVDTSKPIEDLLKDNPFGNLINLVFMLIPIMLVVGIFLNFARGSRF